MAANRGLVALVALAVLVWGVAFAGGATVAVLTANTDVTTTFETPDELTQFNETLDNATQSNEIAGVGLTAAAGNATADTRGDESESAVDAPGPEGNASVSNSNVSAPNGDNISVPIDDNVSTPNGGTAPAPGDSNASEPGDDGDNVSVSADGGNSTDLTVNEAAPEPSPPANEPGSGTDADDKIPADDTDGVRPADDDPADNDADGGDADDADDTDTNDTDQPSGAELTGGGT